MPILARRDPAPHFAVGPTWRQRAWWMALVTAVTLPFAADAQSPDVRRCIGDGQPDARVDACRSALQAAPHDQDVRRSLASALLARGDAAGALREYQRILREDSTSAPAHLDVATTLDRLGRADEALVEYRRYLALDPDEPRAHELVGWLLLQQQRPLDALTEFRAAQRLAPARGSAYHGAGIALVALDRREEALATLREATRFSPDDADIWGEAASTAADLGRVSDALEAWDRARQADARYFERRPDQRRRWQRLSALTPRRAAPTPMPQTERPGLETRPHGAVVRDSAPAGVIRRNGPDASGSGFVVSADGYIVTNRHVVNGCRAIAVRADSAGSIHAELIGIHPRSDLAVLRAPVPFRSWVEFRTGAPIRPGDDVVAVGFPLAGLLADEPSVTIGSVNAMAGLHNDPSTLQMSAPVQQGSSGGPLLDASGHVVGIVVTKLNARMVAEETGDLPQNVNFALKADVAARFLDELGVRYTVAASTLPLGRADVGDIGRRATLMVECYR